MVTVIEIIDDQPYVYVTTNKHFQRIKKTLTPPILTKEQLNQDCCISRDCSIVIPAAPLEKI